MRSNLPVTHNEFVVPDGVNLVSTTDLQSHITYCNPAFVAVSGYDRGELIGQPHNLVRHPDMPQEAFRDMWETLKSGSPWSALVKNRRKNGDHYWVVANATPSADARRTRQWKINAGATSRGGGTFRLAWSAGSSFATDTRQANGGPHIGARVFGAIH